MIDAQELVRRIYARCEEEGECLVWTGARYGGGAMYASHKGKKYSVRRTLWAQKHGPIPDGMNVSDSCGNPRCVRHLVCITVAKRNAKVAAAGWYASPAHRAKVSAGKTRNSKLSDAAVAEIVTWTGRVPEIAAKFGVTEAYAYMLRRGQFRAIKANPFAGLMG